MIIQVAQVVSGHQVSGSRYLLESVSTCVLFVAHYPFLCNPVPVPHTSVHQLAGASVCLAKQGRIAQYRLPALQVFLCGQRYGAFLLAMHSPELAYPGTPGTPTPNWASQEKEKRDETSHPPFKSSTPKSCVLWQHSTCQPVKVNVHHACQPAQHLCPSSC